MSLSLSIAVYLTLWWVTLFAVLPLGVVSHAEAGIDKGDGGDPGAPVDPKLKRKFITTTWVSAIIFAVFWLAVEFHVLRLPALSAMMHGQ
jgi:predicted secreted protein